MANFKRDLASASLSRKQDFDNSSSSRSMSSKGGGGIIEDNPDLTWFDSDVASRRKLLRKQDHSKFLEWTKLLQHFNPDFTKNRRRASIDSRAVTAKDGGN